MIGYSSAPAAARQRAAKAGTPRDINYTQIIFIQMYNEPKYNYIRQHSLDTLF